MLQGGLVRAAMPLRRADFFAHAAAPPSAAGPGSGDEGAGEDGDGEAGEGGDQEGPAAAASQLREGALERIAHLTAGRVSFLLDSDVGAYPRRLFVGEEVPDVPYLRLTACPMAPFHAQTLAREHALMNLKLGERRNNLMQLQIDVMAVTLGLAMCSTVSGWFGMNLDNGFCGPDGCHSDTYNHGFPVFVSVSTVTSAVAVTATLYVLFAARYSLGGSDTRKGKRAD